MHCKISSQYFGKKMVVLLHIVHLNFNIFLTYDVVSLNNRFVVVVVVLLFYVHGKHLRSCRDGQLT